MEHRHPTAVRGALIIGRGMHGVRQHMGEAATLQQVEVLLAIAAEPGVTQMGIQAQTGVSRSHVSKTTWDLMCSELVTSEINPRNRRQRIQYLTPKGVEAAQAIIRGFGL